MKDARIIIPRQVALKVPKKMIYPALGELVMDCGKCQEDNFRCREFGIHVRPERKLGTAVVTELICKNCGAVFKLDPNARLGGGDQHIRRSGHANLTK